MQSKHDIPLFGLSLQIVKKYSAHLADVLYGKFGCVATFEGLDLEGNSSTARQKRGAVPQEKRCEFLLHTGVKVSVWKADLTELNVDAVVNAANEHLSHGAGLAEALCRVGGSQIQAESYDYIQRHGPLQTGDAIVTSAGRLPCQHIIHAVGPRLDSQADLNKAEPLLERAIRNILTRVRANHLQTVAIPAISSGIFNYPLKHCANTIVKTVKSFCQDDPFQNKPIEILLANHDEPSVKEMERACREILSSSVPTSYSQAASHKAGSGASTSAPTVQLGNVTVILKKGYIEEQRTDVIVNTASNDRDLNKGQIASALLWKDGPEMQKDLLNAEQDNVIFTKANKLNCKEVYHTFCSEKKYRGSTQELLQAIKKCMWSAVAADHKSIAFPAIGTGMLRFTHKEVALTMSEAVLDLAQKSLKKIEIHFVIFPSDDKTFKAFEEQVKSLPSKMSKLHLPQGLGNVDHSDSHPSSSVDPVISLMGPSDESMKEAEKWLSDLFEYLDTITNNFIQHFSDKEHQHLSRLKERSRVFLEEFLTKGHAVIRFDGEMREDVVGAILQVEAALCKVQQEFVKDQEKEMVLMTSEKKVFYERTVLEHSSREFRALDYTFRNAKLKIIKVEKVVNPILEKLFFLKMNQLNCSSPRQMYQRISAQFCEMVSHIGFHAECAPPEDSEFGEGIYFVSNLDKARKVWKENREEFQYFVEAEVLTGNSTRGKPGLILPPFLKKDPSVLFDSVDGGSDLSVIFSGYQAVPRYIITCKRL